MQPIGRTTALIAIFALMVSGYFLPAQELTFHASVDEEAEFVIFPHRDTSVDIHHDIGDLQLNITSDDTHRTYEVRVDETTYVAHAELAGPQRHFVFDPQQRRIRTMTSSVIVELSELGTLDDVLATHDLPWGREYPGLGFAVIRLVPGTNPTTLVETLRLDPRVSDAQVTFEDQFRKRVGRSAPMGPSLRRNDLSPNDKDSLTPSFFVYATFDFTESEPKFSIQVLNLGGTRTTLSTLRSDLLTIVPDEVFGILGATTDSLVSTDTTRVPILDPKGAPFKTSVTFPTESLEAGTTYFVLFSVFDGTSPDFDFEDPLTEAASGFTLDHLKRIRHTCIESGQAVLTNRTDPLQNHQWHLANTGQRAFAILGGTVGEDMGMSETLRDGPTGFGVDVAVVDTGLELCHPDLWANVEQGASFNFNATTVESDTIPPRLFRHESTDPFNFDPTHAHGSAVAGLIASTAENGIGDRGIAPGARLRGYNLLNASEQLHATIASLGASDFQPDSTDVDIFNMSFGGLGVRPSKLLVHEEQLLLHGVRKLRDGKGAIYVKAAGNSFYDCHSLYRDLNDDIGCISSIADPMQTLPYLINAGAYNANGEKSSYSSAGPDLWVSAPGGEFGTNSPALITVDSMGPDRGFAVLSQAVGNPNQLEANTTLNPYGDYTSIMNGTSAAAPNVVGAVAILLEENPEFTWRDVKHILAKSARKIDADIEAIELRISGSSRTVRLPWTENAAGYAFHNWYGFGAVAIDDALEFTQTYEPDSLGPFRESGWFELSEPIAIPDNSVTGVNQTMTIRGIPEDVNIEAVVVEIDWEHEFPNDLGVHLISPEGTRSVISQVFNETLAVQDMGTFTWRMLSNAFYGENPNGDWRLEVFDADADDTGQMFAWRIRIYYGVHE